jgi:hypothetical protein
MRGWSLVLAVWVSGCAPLTPQGKGVSVYTASLDALPAERTLPDGCSLLSRRPPSSRSEVDLLGQKEPFRIERNDAGAAGANALLVLTRMIQGRHDPECTSALPITDCPGTDGAWYRVVIERYVCTPDALSRLANAPPPARTPNREPLHP